MESNENMEVNRPCKNFCVLNCDNSKAWQSFSFGDMFSSLLQSDGDKWTIVNVDAGEEIPPDIITKFDGIVLTGSRCNCRDGTKILWFEPVCRMIRTIYEKGSPRLYGGCFGCQIIAHALGGIVDYNPTRKFCLKAEVVTPIVTEDVLKRLISANAVAKPLKLLESHGDCVVQLPDCAIPLASSSTCCNEIFVAGKDADHKNILGCQSHPEFELQYCIFDRIWPAVTKSKRIDEEDYESSRASLESFTRDEGADELISMIRDFLHQ